MRTLPLPIVMTVLLALAGCTQEKAAEQSSHENAVASREDIALRFAHATEATGDLAAAEKLYLKITGAHPSRVGPHIELAEFYRRHNNPNQAIAAYDDALKLAPENTGILRSKANTYINAGRTKQALETLDRAVALDPNDPLLYNSRGVALDMEGRYGEAQQAYRKARELAPGDAATFDANLSMSYILSGNYGAAINLLRPLLNTPDATPTLRQNLALAYGLKGERGNALALGLKDLTPGQADENLKFYRMVSPAPQTATPHDAASIRATIRDVFPEEDDPSAHAAGSAETVSAKATAPTPSPPYRVETKPNAFPIADAPIVPAPAPFNLPEPVLRSTEGDATPGTGPALSADEPQSGSPLPPWPAPVPKPEE